MVYVALLRGINVGGRNKVEMARLRAVLGGLGLGDVRTYIASGNVVFTTSRKSAPRLAAEIGAAILEEFGFPVEVLVRDGETIRAVADAIPPDWVNDAETKTDVMYLWDEADGPDVLDRITVEEGIDEVRRVPGALIWRTERARVKRSGRMKLGGSALYALMTVRNCNTARTLAAMVEEASGP